MKNKGGAPKKEINRDKYIKIYLTSKEKQQIKLKLDKSIHNTFSDLARSILLKNEYKVVSIDEKLIDLNNQLIGETRKIGVNFNQLIKVFNTKKKDNFSQDDINKLLFLMQNIEKNFKLINEKI